VIDDSLLETESPKVDNEGTERLSVTEDARLVERSAALLLEAGALGTTTAPMTLSV
jgi:hypothetical protein